MKTIEATRAEFSKLVVVTYPWDDTAPTNPAREGYRGPLAAERVTEIRVLYRWNIETARWARSSLYINGHRVKKDGTPYSESQQLFSIKGFDKQAFVDEHRPTTFIDWTEFEGES